LIIFFIGKTGKVTHNILLRFYFFLHSERDFRDRYAYFSFFLK
jgi:hypothetical protein